MYIFSELLASGKSDVYMYIPCTRQKRELYSQRCMRRVSRQLKVPCSYLVNAIGEFALLMYLSEFRFQVLTAITSELILDLPMQLGTIRNK